MELAHTSEALHQDSFWQQGFVLHAFHAHQFQPDPNFILFCPADSKIQNKDAVVIDTCVKFMAEVMASYRTSFKVTGGQAKFDLEEFIKNAKTKEIRKVCT